MKATVENSVSFELSEDITIYLEFVEIINRTVSAKSEQELRDRFIVGRYRHFKIGFGSSHMWVKQYILGEPKQQVIFVQF